MNDREVHLPKTTQCGQPAGSHGTRPAPHLVGDPSKEGFHVGLPRNMGNCRTRATSPQGLEAPPHLWVTACQSNCCARAKQEMRGCEGNEMNERGRWKNVPGARESYHIPCTSVMCRAATFRSWAGPERRRQQFKVRREHKLSKQSCGCRSIQCL